MTVVQSPAIGNALRQALSLDAAGPLPLECETFVQPVCIVGDVRAQLFQNVRTFSNWRNVTAVAAQFSQVALRCPTKGAAGKLLYAVPRVIRIRDTVGAAVYWRLGTGTPPVGTDAVPRSLVSDSFVAGVCSLVGGANAVAPVTTSQQGIFTGTATTIEWRPPEMRLVPDAQSETFLHFYSDTVLTTLIVDCIWDEYYQP